MMKLVATFEENLPIEVLRFENDVQVGKRQVNYENFVRGLATELSVPALLTIILERSNEFTSHLDNAQNDDYGLFEGFMDSLIKGLDKETFIMDTLQHPLVIQKLAKYHELIDLTDPQGVEFLNRSIKALEKNSVASSPELLELGLNLIQRLALAKGKKVRKEFANGIYQLLETSDKRAIMNLVESFLPTFEENWLRQVFKEAFKEKSKANNPVRHSVKLPKNCVWVQTHETSVKYVIEIPKAQFRVAYYDMKFEQVGHPRMLSIIEVDNKNNVVNMKMVAIKESAEIELTTPIYCYPYSNVHSSGEVCWSGYRGEFSGDLGYLPSLFLSAQNNSHLSSGNLAEIYASYNGRDFSDKDLMPMQYENLKTLADIL